ncbi:hypothetical protein THRCLA_03227 [Thraustotheca clavata]|uniref:M96 mating-specific protein family n=1 Tax=Thraustotheca clavata TaxID=74557 RepID=A0A1W0A2X5_9STRA|nr:hypothetical protein THRCLA_03227 [Thraustotheca clavata]
MNDDEMVDALGFDDLLTSLDFDLSMGNIGNSYLVPTEVTTPSSPEEKRSVLPATRRTQRHRKRHQDELAFLKSKVKELTEHLQILQHVKELEADSEPCCEWKKLAQNEKKREQEVMSENRRLKDAIEEQVKFAEYLVTILEKKPRLGLLSPGLADQWQMLKLVAEPTARAAAFHAIADREYAKVESVMIEGNLIDRQEESHSYIPKLINGVLEVQTAVFILYPVHYNLLAEASWRVLRGSIELDPMTGIHASYQLLHEIDPNTVYISSMWHYSGGGYQARMIVKRYIEENRQIIISRSIHEDELHPLVEGCAIANECSYLSFDKDPATGLARARYFQRMKPTYFTQEIHDRSHLSLCEFLMELCEQSSMTFEYTIKCHLYLLLSKPIPPKKRPIKS